MMIRGKGFSIPNNIRVGDSAGKFGHGFINDKHAGNEFFPFEDKLLVYGNCLDMKIITLIYLCNKSGSINKYLICQLFLRCHRGNGCARGQGR